MARAATTLTPAEEFGEEIEQIGKKITLLQKHRRSQWEQLKAAVYKRRGLEQKRHPDTEDSKTSWHIDYPEVVALLEKHQAGR